MYSVVECNEGVVVVVVVVVVVAKHNVLECSVV